MLGSPSSKGLSQGHNLPSVPQGQNETLDKGLGLSDRKPVVGHIVESGIEETVQW